MNTPLSLPHFLNRFTLCQPAAGHRQLTGRQAAVLVPVVDRPRPGLLLTRRASSLRKHAGQVAFPGGMRDSDDSSLIATALREASEEIALPSSAVQILGVLPAVTSSTGFQVTPVVGLIPAGLPLRASPDEVESLFEMPLELALRMERYHPLEISRQGKHHTVWLSWYQNYFVWGMTAGIIRDLSQQILDF